MENLTQRLRKLKLDIRIGMEEKQINQDLGIILLDDLEKAINDTHSCKSDSEKLNCFRQWLIDEKKNIHIYQHSIEDYLKTTQIKQSET